MENSRESSILKYFDIFGIPYLFTFNEENKYQAYFGGIITIISIMFGITILYFLGEEIFYKTNPKNLLTIEKFPLPPKFIYSMSNAFLLVDENSSFIDNYEKYIRFEGYYQYYKNDENGIFNSEVGYPFILTSRKCKVTDFPNEASYQYKIMSLDEAICIDNPMVELGGYFSGNYTKYLNIVIKPCINETSDNKCASKEEITEIFSYGQRSISMHSDSLQYNPSNYSYPVQKFISEDNYKFDIMFCKQITYFIQEMKIITDSGIFWKELSSSSYQMIDNIKIESYRNNNSNNKFSDQCLFDFKFFSSMNLLIYRRSYLKGSEILAQMGGILNIYLLFGRYIFYFIYRSRMSESIITKLYHISEEDFMNDSNSFLDISKNNKLKKQNSTYQNNIVINLSNDKKIDQYIENENIHKENIYNNNYTSNLRLGLKDYSNNLIIKKKERKFKIFSYSEHCCITFFKCFVNKLIKEKIRKFDILKKISSQYTDITKIIKKLNEISKLKFLLLNKKQLAVFNLIDSPHAPLATHKIPKYSEKYKYEMNYELQKIKAEEFLSTPISILFKNNIDRRLFKFMCN